MTTRPGDGESAERAPTRQRRSLVGSVWAVLRVIGSRIRRDPFLGVPFAIAGALLALADVVRNRDPIPVTRADWFGETVSVQYSIYPTGTVRTVRDVGALVDLQTPSLLWGVGIELLVVLAIGIAGWATITRSLGVRRSLASLARYLGLVATLELVPPLFGGLSIDVQGLLPGFVLLAGISLVLVRLYLVPASLVAGRGFADALRDSVDASRGRRWTIFGLILVFGVASWGLAHVPTVGAFLSTAIVAPLQAASFAAFVHQQGSEGHGTPSDFSYS